MVPGFLMRTLMGSPMTSSMMPLSFSISQWRMWSQMMEKIGRPSFNTLIHHPQMFWSVCPQDLVVESATRL
uniref:Uncharacterized protein MANES_11G146600 n=1 Tax=Rhizophora mucronata TaxID=61149 RepID=A0A2P2KFI9_RHIMU